MAKATDKEAKDVVVNNPVDIDFLNIPSPSDFLDLDEVVEPLVEIETYFNTPVILSNPQLKEGDKGNYFIFEVQEVSTGNIWKSSCSHWFMMEYCRKVKAKTGKLPFPMVVEFYKAENRSIKFRDVEGRNRQATNQIPF